MTTTDSNYYYRMLYGVKSYSEFALKCAILGISVPDQLDENCFNHYHVDDFRWEVFLLSFTKNMKLPDI